MKAIKTLTIVALCASSLSPIAIAPAMAITPNGDTVATMDGVCSSELSAKAATPLHDGSPSLTVAVVETGQSDGPTTEVPGSRVETPGTRFGTGLFTYSDFQIKDPIFRTGGSVNLFGDKVARNKNWANSEYDFLADYSTTTTISYNCEYTRYTEVFHAAVPGQPAQGYYYLDPTFTPGSNGNGHGGGNGNGGGGVSCDQFNAKDPNTWEQWGENQAQCLFFTTAPAVDPIDEYYEDPVAEAAAELTSNHSVDETNIAAGLPGHEANAGAWTERGEWLAEKVVVCISPKKLPGTWTAQNGYGGANCRTDYFKIAPWGGGSQTSNGTYISVPGY